MLLSSSHTHTHGARTGSVAACPNVLLRTGKRQKSCPARRFSSVFSLNQTVGKQGHVSNIWVLTRHFSLFFVFFTHVVLFSEPEVTSSSQTTSTKQTCCKTLSCKRLKITVYHQYLYWTVNVTREDPQVVVAAEVRSQTVEG